MAMQTYVLSEEMLRFFLHERGVKVNLSKHAIEHMMAGIMRYVRKDIMIGVTELKKELQHYLRGVLKAQMDFLTESSLFSSHLKRGAHDDVLAHATLLYFFHIKEWGTKEEVRAYFIKCRGAILGHIRLADDQFDHYVESLMAEVPERELEMIA